MTVIAFESKLPQRDGSWHAGELKAIMDSFAAQLSTGEAGGWDVGATEIGDPQFYLLGPLPHEDCILCISRLDRIYVLEDGAGRVLFEHNSVATLAERARSILQKKKAQIAVRATLLWCAVREMFKEKLDAMAGEGEELLVHFVPQLAAFA
jgi:hypothetical protein